MGYHQWKLAAQEVLEFPPPNIFLCIKKTLKVMRDGLPYVKSSPEEAEAINRALESFEEHLKNFPHTYHQYLEWEKEIEAVLQPFAFIEEARLSFPLWQRLHSRLDGCVKELGTYTGEGFEDIKPTLLKYAAEAID
ncbi:MAG TPA: hypothetical protein ENJ54_04140 [Chloroflexi bacterium]|nr:hypothetical protein [Chloroflexota bacterium]